MVDKPGCNNDALFACLVRKGVLFIRFDPETGEGRTPPRAMALLGLGQPGEPFDVDPVGMFPFVDVLLVPF